MSTLQGKPRGHLLLVFSWGLMAGMAWVTMVLPLQIMEGLEDEVRRSLYLALEEEWDFNLAAAVFVIALIGYFTAQSGIRRKE